MIELLVVIVTAGVVIAAAAVVGPRIGVAAPLVLVAVGVAASFLPVFDSTVIEPEWILEGLLPPLLYSSAVSMPSMNFRREFAAISGLSVLLVIGTSLALGLFFVQVIPGLSFAWGVALGAIVSPTDAVATRMIKQTPVSKRVVAMLDGESLLNDATALVLLRSAIVATAATFSLWGTAGRLVYSVLVAVAIGWGVGRLNLLVRRRISDPAVNTVLSFVVPFVASVPASLLGASGLVAAVVAGLVTGIRAPRELSPQSRLSDAQNWRTVELVLEGVVFLTMGLQIRSIVSAVQHDHGGVGTALVVAAGALVVTLLLRGAFVATLLRALQLGSTRAQQLRPRLESMQQDMSTPEGQQVTLDRMAERRRRVSVRDLDRLATRVVRSLADIDYFLRQPLGWRDGVIVVWAGMRGAVTVAAAQTLPDDGTPQRSVLVLVAFTVAALSLVVQGGTVGPLVRRLAPPNDDAEADAPTEERTRLMALLRERADAVPQPERDGEAPRLAQFRVEKAYRLAVLAAQRSELLDARDNGTFDADLLEEKLANLDASEIAIDMRGRSVS